MHTSNTEQNSKDNSMEWLLEELRLLKAGANIDTDVDIQQTHTTIRSHLLADVMRVLGSSKYNCYDEQCWYDLSEDEQKGIQELYEHLEQAFNELLGGSDE